MSNIHPIYFAMLGAYLAFGIYWLASEILFRRRMRKGRNRLVSGDSIQIYKTPFTVTKDDECE